jgi:general secretion pathway protein L
MFQVFLHWWLAQLAGLLPAEWWQGGARLPDGIILAADQQQLAASLRRRGQSYPLGRFATDKRGAADLNIAASEAGADKLPAALALTPGQVLNKTISLPLAARRNIGQVLEFELDRETPFRAEEVLWTFRIGQLHRDADRVDVELDLVPRAAVAATVMLVEAAGLRVEAVEFADRHGKTRRIGVNESAPGRSHRYSRLDLALAGVAALLMLAAVATPFVRLERALIDARADVTRLRSAGQTAITLKRDADRLSKAASTVADQYERMRDPLQVLAAATRALPDSTFLTEFTIRGDRATLVGLSSSAARLIETLAKTPPFRDPAFGAPVVRPNGKALELFTINATLAPTTRR